MDDGQEKMKAQVGSLVSRVNANQEEMRYTVSTFEEKMDA
jgi:hypothetical protein